jgi:hypothetical protein
MATDQRLLPLHEYEFAVRQASGLLCHARIRLRQDRIADRFTYVSFVRHLSNVALGVLVFSQASAVAMRPGGVQRQRPSSDASIADDLVGSTDAHPTV